MWPGHFFLLPGPVSEFESESEYGLVRIRRCIGTSPLNAEIDLFSSIKFVQVTSEAIVFHTENKTAIFHKPFLLLKPSFWDEEFRPPQTAQFRLYRAPRICDDVDVTIEFMSDDDAAAFRANLCKACPPDSREFHLPTKVYTLQQNSREAHILRRDDPVVTIINETLTALAFTAAGRVLIPLLNWTVSVNPRSVAVQTEVIHLWLQGQHPPLVVIAQADRNLSTAGLIFRDDLESPPLSPLHRLPVQPVDGSLKHLPCPPDGTVWAKQIISDYGVHCRQRDTPGPPIIVLSTELIDWYRAAFAAHTLSADANTVASLEAATASLKLTIVHEVAHVWVTQNQIEDSAARGEVTGADECKYDVAEDDRRPGFIEPGNLIETVWLGGPHSLVLDNGGWLRLVVLKTMASADTSDTDGLPSPVANIEAQLSPTQVAAPLSDLTVDADDSDSDSSASFKSVSSEPQHSPNTPFDPHSSTSPTSTIIPSLRSPSTIDGTSIRNSEDLDATNSPLPTGTQPPGSSSRATCSTTTQRSQTSVISLSDAVSEQQLEQDRLQTVVMCSSSDLKLLCAPGLPRFPDGIVGDSKNLVLFKSAGSSKVKSASPNAAPAQPPRTPRPRQPLFQGKVATLVLDKEKHPKLWPSVLKG
ncbi:hypothetical protein R3P38DRAFT_13252 [Favolaschia claudopus]|uniref:Uncharacterized protein n=1 Tax=Favolaschia claudopus TaxID=2862362 RepID=A0AAW0EFT3_9AGAR